MSITPSTLEAGLRAGRSIHEIKTVHVPELPPRADVVFSFDLTGSMGDILDTAKTKTAEIINNLNTLGIDVQYGVTSHMDYPAFYDSYGYAADYGIRPDYPYQMNHSVSGNVSEILSAINGLTLANGADFPECYTRVFYESYADESLGWRVGAKKIFVHFGDSIPHDDDLNEGVPGTSGTWSTGGDPGRDAVMFTADDLDLQPVLQEMKNHNVVLLEGQTADSFLNYWNTWTGITGGSTYLTGSSTFVEDVTTAIINALTAETVTGLHLETSAGYKEWLSSVAPPSYSGSTDVDVSFAITITVPEGTPDGEYCFSIFAFDDEGVSFGQQAVCIEVTSGLERDDVIALLFASIAFEELGLAHIVNSEAEKIQYVLGTLPGRTPPAQATLEDLLNVDQAVRQVLRDVVKKEMLLQFQLDDLLTPQPETP